jgi:hypothetical protein
MSMNGKLRRIAAADLPRVRSDESFVVAATGLGGFDVSSCLGELPWFIRLLLRFSGPKFPSAPKGVTPAGELLNLHKSWHGLHYLLTQDPWAGEPPLKNAVLGATEVGDDLSGYGPPRLNTPDEVREIQIALSALSTASLLQRYEARRLDELEIYPGGWAQDADWRGELKRDFARLKDFYQRAATAGDATLNWID